MKVAAFFLLSLFASALQAQSALPGQKRALIVAIGDYPETGGWSKLSSARDIPYVKQALFRQGFEESNISVLSDSEATRAGIENAMKKLLADCKKGDIVVIHFSSHGEQIEDDNGDEVDGLDEAIVAYDAVAPSKSTDYGKDTIGYFRDDLFGRYVKQLRGQLGSQGDLVVFMDACHSGSGTRGQLKARGGQPALVSKNFAPGQRKIDSKGVFQEDGGDATGDLAAYIVFSAARAEELAFEVNNENNESMGSLSYSISRVFEQLESGTTYRGLFSRLQSVLNSKVQGQHPVMEGNGTDRLLFGGKFVHQKSFVEINKVVNPQTLEINAGLFAGLNVGAVVALYPSSTLDPAKSKALDTGVVVAASAYKSTIKTNKSLVKQTSDFWVFVLEPVYNIEPVVLEINKKKGRIHTFSVAEEQRVIQELKDMNLIQYTGTPELLLSKGPQDDSLILYTNGYVFAVIPRDDEYSSNLRTHIEQFAQYKFLQSLQLTDSTCMVDVQLVPVINGNPDVSKIGSNMKNGTLSFTDNEIFTLQVTNKGNYDVYINVLDMQPDGWINPVMPKRDAENPILPADLKIKAGETRLFSELIIELAEPYGTEVFKVFVSRKQIDLEMLVTRKDNEQHRGNFGPLEKLVKKSMDATRGAGSVKVGSSNGSIQDIIFEIKPGH